MKITVESKDIINWVKCGDVAEAEEMVKRLETTLITLAADENYRKILDAGVMPLLSKNELSFIAQMLNRKSTDERNKNNKSGYQLMVKVLVQNKPIKSQFRAIWLARMASINITNTNIGEFDRVACFVNSLILRNNKILVDFKRGKNERFDDYQPSYPKRETTADEIQKAYYKFLKTGTIGKADTVLNATKLVENTPNKK